MTLPKSLTTVTTFSKLLALIVILIFILCGFYAGIYYQKQTDKNNLSVIPNQLISPTITQSPSDKTTCTKDRDCVLSEISNDTTATCCPNTKCLDLSQTSVEAVNAKWFNNQKQTFCSGHYMCPMIYAVCTKEITQNNSHYSAKCESGECVKTYQ